MLLLQRCNGLWLLLQVLRTLIGLHIAISAVGCSSSVAMILVPEILSLQKSQAFTEVPANAFDAWMTMQLQAQLLP